MGLFLRDCPDAQDRANFEVKSPGPFPLSFDYL